MAHNQQVWDLIDFEDWLDADMEAAGYEIERHGARRPRYIVPDRMDPFVAMTKEEFVDRFRLPKHSVVELIGEIQEQLPAANDRRGCPVPPSLQVLIAIRCMAAGGHQISVGDCFDVSQAKVSECLKAVSRAIASLCRQYIRFPVGGKVRTHLRTTQAIIVAAMVLHNKAVLTRVVMDEGQEIDVDNDAVLPAHINETVQGRVKRQQIIRHYF
ncbi:hypothetical protein Pcinc_006043 [Petrolisthes cinctipes]|uniref:Nuclease HARBI1 n=1 Tax=Petrolisthes cinctipes TaxID=88211 RepID=A0AAE1GBG9_PETCI|nr:hypothetical protein Pcinc_031067 [Petrolisthes cinctipes]KAK3889994.1 hypothetical protein Pcinc_006043 [Petrolisthes cinctipes]